MTEQIEIENRISDLLEQLTLKEKFKLLASHGRRRIYTTDPINRLKIPSFKMTDGPLGASFHSSGLKKNTRFPAPIGLAASWNKDLTREVGEAMGEEVRAIGRHMILAPAMNIHRTPLCGRTFEYFSEDPFLTKEIAIHLLKGIQSKGIGGCLKHYVANNQETDRASCSAEIDERTLHEIYLRAFRAVVKEGDPWAVMAAYNKINGVYACANKELLRDLLFEKWGFNGILMTDWFSTRKDQTTEGCINAGLSLEMPWVFKYKIKHLQKAYDAGSFNDETLDDLVRRNLRVMMRTGAIRGSTDLLKGARNTVHHQNLARRAAEEGMVLLKNDGDLLPLDIESIDRIALLGPNLKKKFGGFLKGGSSGVKPPYEITPLAGMKEKCKGKVKIVNDASQADLAIVFAGLDNSKGGDSEFQDRSSLNLPPDQIALINHTVATNPNTIVVLIAGSPLAMNDWLDKVPVVLQAWYPGMEGGRAIANVLFGDANPSGKLPLTFPKILSDSPAHNTGDPRNFPGDEEKRVFYDEGIFVGYRWFDEKNIEPLFPFGFGRSYTTFEFGEVHPAKSNLRNSEDTLSIEVGITNTGDLEGAEVVQVYAHDFQSSVERPPRELVGFEKVNLRPGESKSVPILVKAEDLAFYDVTKHDWTIEPGNFNFLIGNSSRSIFLDARFSYG
ncbi:MAG: glycoside hydrolase family 3 C-terminal domain-containing protein [Candidatus Thorarchaeota archaeon]|nr:glycoside hydrolase family 3 C-terminal domain-containing protein [Candidatus Thorarchaeota archaeon]